MASALEERHRRFNPFLSALPIATTIQRDAGEAYDLLLMDQYGPWEAVSAATPILRRL